MELVIYLLCIGTVIYVINKAIDRFADNINPYNFSKRK